MLRASSTNAVDMYLIICDDIQMLYLLTKLEKKPRVTILILVHQCMDPVENYLLFVGLFDLRWPLLVVNLKE